MAYQHGVSSVAQAEARRDEAKAKLLELEAQILEAKAEKLQAKLKIEVAETYPYDPDWARHRLEANAELAAYDRAKRARDQAKASGRPSAHVGLVAA